MGSLKEKDILHGNQFSRKEIDLYSDGLARHDLRKKIVSVPRPFFFRKQGDGGHSSFLEQVL